VTELIDRLVANGYVIREADAKDRRRIVVTINEQAVTAARRHFALPNPSLAPLYDRYTVRELEVIADFLHRNAQRLRQELSLL
jgi:DNA-binding MarR family transcriptional regulator